MRRRMYLRLGVVLVTISVVIFTTLPAAALRGVLWDLFDNNGAYYYDPESLICYPSSVNVGSGTLYNGNQVLNENALARISENQPFYQAAAEKYGLDWQIIAALHYRETGAIRYNPGNGQGAYQLYSYTGGGKNSNAFAPSSQISDAEFQRQTDIVAGLIKNNYGSGLDLSTDEGVKTMFFRYNGVASSYISQARSMGYSAAEAASGEGSPYVMNMADARRDSSVNANWGQILTDGGSMKTANQVPGAFVIYSSLGGGNGIDVCVDANGNSVNGYVGGSAAEVAMQLAWGLRSDTSEASEAYRAAAASVGLTGDWTDCGRFVATVMRVSGVDTTMPTGTSTMYSYLSRSSAWSEIPNTGSTAVLQPGDIIIRTAGNSKYGHVKLYVEQNGVGGEVQASLGDHAPRFTRGVTLGSSYHIFRHN